MKCGCGVDIHAHVVPENFPAYLGSSVPKDWPSMAPAHECHRHVMISGKVYRTVSDKCWDVSKRIEDMAGMELSLQAISPMPELLSYWMAPNDAAQLLRYINEQMAEMVALSGGRLCAFGALPLQDMDLALAELDYVIDKLGFAGVEIGSNINGKPIGAPEFAPFFEAAQEKGIAVFVHALKPAGMDRLVGPAQLQQALAYPTDVGLAAASCLTSNLIERFPKLRIAFSHGGGTLAMLLPRLEQARRVFPALKEAVTLSPTEQARKLYYDALVFDAPTLKHLVSTFGASQLIIGTDYPFAFHDRTPVASILAAEFGDAVNQQLVRENAQRFLGLNLTMETTA
ncbi:aminocarboxymuconate-semialdehyde decarboxylase [Noviherbaspirillum humi]|uniref:2-amino-3-carboxymuconate-6-semialdehyde decarboxylase n=1 Tax=Noviherbaspirillum humi TaxID=1688639 RepID=A0A239LY60_9BURK|nr:amidohydrolase family protein [Noviherbaspirillum humi]SNT34733.1 aminocarboxymuconate-semialdehyde decarboxylase [Noviherbaspirillum humi]